jgi:hypothetical protein
VGHLVRVLEIITVQATEFLSENLDFLEKIKWVGDIKMDLRVTLCYFGLIQMGQRRVW